MSHYNSLSSKNKKALRRVQLYFTISAGAQYVLYNAILQGGLFAPAPNVKVNVSNQEGTVEYIRKPYQPIENIVENAACGPVFVYSPICVSFTQTYSTPVLKGVYNCKFGNVSIYYSF